MAHEFRGLIDSAGAALLFTLPQLRGSWPLQGHIPALPDLGRINCLADEEIGSR